MVLCIPTISLSATMPHPHDPRAQLHLQIPHLSAVALVIVTQKVKEPMQSQHMQLFLVAEPPPYGLAGRLIGANHHVTEVELSARIRIARRTVAKYREALGIPIARLRVRI